MRKGFLVLVAMFLVSGVCYGEIEYTYKKVSKDVLKILEVETTQRISEINITIKNLRVRIANLEGAKNNALAYYTETAAKIDEKIAFIETQINKAIELGVEEPIESE